VARLMAPVLTFTGEEVWQALHRRPESEPLRSSVHAEEFPAPLALAARGELTARWDRLFEVREDVLKALEVSRAAGTNGNGLEAEVTIEAPDDPRPLLGRHAAAPPA